MLTNCFRFAPRDSVPGLISKICKYLKDHPGWSVDELKEVIGDIETSLALGEISYFTNQSINDLDTLALYDVGYRFVFIGGGDVYSAMYALEESGGSVIANGVSLGVTESEFNQLKSIVLALNNTAYTVTNPPPYPVTKVNNRTGDVKLDLADVLGESTAQTMLMSEINFASTQLATWNAFYDYGYRVVGVLANDGSAITALYILGQNVGNHAPIPMDLPSGGNVISVNGDIGEVHTLRVDPADPGIPTEPPTPINATTLGGKPASEYLTTNNVVNNLATTEPGYVADARLVKYLEDNKLNIKNAFFGNASSYSDTNATDFDVFIDGVTKYGNIIQTAINRAAVQHGDYYFGNLQYVIYSVNFEKTYGWLLSISFSGIYFGYRRNSSTFTWAKIV